MNSLVIVFAAALVASVHSSAVVAPQQYVYSVIPQYQSQVQSVAAGQIQYTPGVLPYAVKAGSPVGGYISVSSAPIVGVGAGQVPFLSGVSSILAPSYYIGGAAQKIAGALIPGAQVQVSAGGAQGDYPATAYSYGYAPKYYYSGAAVPQGAGSYGSSYYSSVIPTYYSGAGVPSYTAANAGGQYVKVLADQSQGKSQQEGQQYQAQYQQGAAAHDGAIVVESH